MTEYKDSIVLKDKVSETLQKITTGFKRVQESASNTQNKLAGLQARMKSFGATTRKVAGNMKNFALGATALVGGTIAVANKVADAGDRVDKMSQKIGMSRKSFQEWDYIMSQNGGSVESLQMGFKTLTTQMENVQKGSKDSVKAFSDLGVSVKDSNGNFRSQDEVFNDSIRALQKIKDPTKKAMLANRLFGRSASDLRPLLNQEAGAIDDLRKKANEMGMIMSDEDIENAVKYKDTMDTLTRVFQAKFATEVMKIMPYLTTSLEWIANTGFPAITTAITGTIKFLQGIGEAIGNFIGTIVSIPTYISIAIDNAMTNIHLFIVNIIKKIEKLRDMILGIGSTLANGAKDLIKNTVSNVKNATTNNNQTYNTSNTTNNTTINNYGGVGSPNRVPA